MYITKINSCYSNTTRGQSDNNQSKNTIVNLINTVDAKTNDFCSKTDNAYNSYSVVPLFSTIMALYGVEALTFVKGINKADKAKWLTPVILFSSLMYAMFTKKRINATYNGHLAGQKQVLQNELKNPKLFIPLNEHQQNTITQNNLYQYYANKEYSNDFNLTPDFNVYYSKEFIKKNNAEAKLIKPTSDKDNDIQKSILEIDKNAWNYSNKVIAGINLIFASGCAATALILQTLSLKSSPIKSGKTFNIIAAIFALVPISVLGKLSISSFYDNLNKVSRYKAKQDFLQSKNHNENPVSTALDYIRNKSEYKKEVQREEDLTAVKNELIQKMDFSQDKLNEAKLLQKDFCNAMNSQARTELIKENKFNNGILREGIINTFLFPLSILPLYNILEILSTHSIKPLKHKTLLTANLLISTACFSNAIIALTANKNNKIKRELYT